MKLLLLFWLVIALIIFIAHKVLPKITVRRIANQNSNFYYGVPGFVKEGMNTLRKTTMENYPYGYATHPPTGWAKNNAITDYHKANDFNESIFTNNKYLLEDGLQFQPFNECI